MVFKYKMRYLVVSKKKIHYLFEGRIEKSVPHDHHLSSLNEPRDAKGRPQDGFFYPTLEFMIYSFTLSQAENSTHIKCE